MAARLRRPRVAVWRWPCGSQQAVGQGAAGPSQGSGHGGSGSAPLLRGHLGFVHPAALGSRRVCSSDPLSSAKARSRGNAARIEEGVTVGGVFVGRENCAQHRLRVMERVQIRGGTVLKNEINGKQE